jgi:hypothetical protein
LKNISYPDRWLLIYYQIKAGTVAPIAELRISPIPDHVRVATKSQTGIPGSFNFFYQYRMPWVWPYPRNFRP